jgi:TolB protein
MKLSRGLTLLLLLAAAALAHAQRDDLLRIIIEKGLDSALPIAIVPFEAGEAAVPLDVAAVIAADLARSGRFAPMPVEDLPSRPSEFSQIRFGDWRLYGMNNLVIGRIQTLPSGEFDIQFRLVDVYSGKQLVGFRVPSTPGNLRLTAHQISDIIYEKLTGERGAFATNVAYVTVERGPGDAKLFKLHLADADGYNARTLLESAEPLLSPAWSPDGRRIAYVSFEDKNSAVYVQDIETGRRERVAGGIGINSAPAWSPDAGRLAMTRSKDGNPEIYVFDLRTRVFRRLTNDPAIDTEPVWSSDGRSIAFTSDRGGGPQIYSIDLLGGDVRRLTFGIGDYAARARFSPDGRSIAFVYGGERGYQIALLDLETRGFRVLTDARLDESPSFAPNGSMIIYTTMGARGTELAATSVDGRVRQRLTQRGGEVREPAWGPFRN